MTVQTIKTRDRVSMSSSMAPWSGSVGEKRSLGVDDGAHQKKQCTEERDEQRLSLPPPLPDDDDEILWSELVEHDGEILEEGKD